MRLAHCSQVRRIVVHRLEGMHFVRGIVRMERLSEGLARTEPVGVVVDHSLGVEHCHMMVLESGMVMVRCAVVVRSLGLLRHMAVGDLHVEVDLGRIVAVDHRTEVVGCSHHIVAAGRSSELHHRNSRWMTC